MSNNLNKHVLFTDSSSVSDICRPLEQYGITGFIYMRHFDDGSFIDLSNQPDWSAFFLNRFFDCKYQSAQIQDHMYIEKGISLWALNQSNLIWQEGQEHFRFGNGISIVSNKKKNNYKETFCFYGDKESHYLSEFYINNMNLLKQFQSYFLEKAKHLISKGYSNKLITPIEYSGIEGKSTLIETLNKPQHLSEREISCLELIAQGYSAEEASERLFISKRTVEAHIRNSKNKLKCKNICDLIYQGTSLGYI